MQKLTRTVYEGVDMMLCMAPRNTLPDYIRAKMKVKNLSAADVARNAGNEVSPTTITKILNGEVSKSGTKTLSLIAKGLGVSEIEILRAANGDDVTRPLHYQIYAERFDAGDISDTEWQFIETNINDFIQRFRLFKQETKDRAMLSSDPPKPLAPVVARIEPGKRLLDADEENEIRERTTPRRKAK